MQKVFETNMEDSTQKGFEKSSFERKTENIMKA